MQCSTSCRSVRSAACGTGRWWTTYSWHVLSKRSLRSQASYYEGNLGALTPQTKASIEDDSWAAQRVSAESFQNRGLYADPATVFSSVLVLIILLALSFQRILGLDRWLAQYLRDYKERRDEEKRREVMDARKALLESWDNNGQGNGQGKAQDNGKGPLP